MNRRPRYEDSEDAAPAVLTLIDATSNCLRDRRSALISPISTLARASWSWRAGALPIAELRACRRDRRHGGADDVPAFLHAPDDVVGAVGGDAARDLVRLAGFQDLLKRRFD